jgi:hypothetical protein
MYPEAQEVKIDLLSFFGTYQNLTNPQDELVESTMTFGDDAILNDCLTSVSVIFPFWSSFCYYFIKDWGIRKHIPLIFVFLENNHQ